VKLPEDMSKNFSSIENMYLESIDFGDNFTQIIESLTTMQNLKSLYIDLDDEDKAGIIIGYL
jgi:hypothetical protein